jgi:hypothetical protein
VAFRHSPRAKQQQFMPLHICATRVQAAARDDGRDLPSRIVRTRALTASAALLGTRGLFDVATCSIRSSRRRRKSAREANHSPKLYAWISDFTARHDWLCVVDDGDVNDKFGL